MHSVGYGISVTSTMGKNSSKRPLALRGRCRKNWQAQGAAVPLIQATTGAIFGWSVEFETTSFGSDWGQEGEL